MCDDEHDTPDSGFCQEERTMAEPNIVVATFTEESKTYQAFSEIKQAGARRQIKLETLAIVRRAADGSLETPEITGHAPGSTFKGGLIGSLVGILGGPLGVLLGWGTGAVIGSIHDANEIRSDFSLLKALSEGMNPGNVALIGEIEESSNEVVNGIVRRLGGEVLRRPVDEIRREIERATKARSAAEVEARRVMGEHPEA
jgi:uncharacterized membrane protein